MLDAQAAIRALIEARFDAISNGTTPAVPAVPVVGEQTNSPNKRSATEYEEDVDAEGEEEEETPVPVTTPARKKQKREPSIEEQDAKLAAQLQAEENSLGRVRKTRGGGLSKQAKKPLKKKQPKKKSKAKVDDSDVEDKEKKPKRNTGLQKPFNLSTPLADLVGSGRMSRPAVVKQIWKHIKANSLQDPNDKRHINCDEKMISVFKVHRVHMFSMNKLLGAHLYPIEEGEEVHMEPTGTPLED